ncbi:MAG: LPXTG cell wall anchor domain-containing protein [Oscillospiraceae bacterium]|nr:LPXTG cell wall anchor domain-containing protein [Oscillospiraceae bacterium]
MINIKYRKLISLFTAMLACLLLAAWLMIPAAAQLDVSQTSTCVCDCDEDCDIDCDEDYDCDCSEDAEVLTTTNTRVRVSGFSQLYQVMMANGAAQNPPVFQWGVGNTVMPVRYHNNTYYIALPGSGLFLAIQGNSPIDGFDFEQGFIVYHAEGVFGSQTIGVDELLDDMVEYMGDDDVASWNAVSAVIPGWPRIESSSEETSSTIEVAEDNDDDNDDDDDKDVLPGLPQTGFALTPGAVVAALILSAGAGYLGIAYAKKVKEDKAAA